MFLMFKVQCSLQHGSPECLLYFSFFHFSRPQFPPKSKSTSAHLFSVTALQLVSWISVSLLQSKFKLELLVLKSTVDPYRVGSKLHFYINLSMFSISCLQSTIASACFTFLFLSYGSPCHSPNIFGPFAVVSCLHPRAPISLVHLFIRSPWYHATHMVSTQHLEQTVMTPNILSTSLKVSNLKDPTAAHLDNPKFQLVLRAYTFAIQSVAQQDKHHLGACKKCRISGNFRLNQDLHFNKTVDMHIRF